MKVSAWVEVEKEVEVEVSLSDVIDELESMDCESTAMGARMLINTCYAVLKRVPDSIISSLTDDQRRLISSALIEQANRYAPEPPQ